MSANPGASVIQTVPRASSSCSNISHHHGGFCKEPTSAFLAFPFTSDFVLLYLFEQRVHFWTLKYQQLCILDVFKAWDYARTISRSKKLHIACPKTDIGAQKYIFCILIRLGCMLYVFYVCILCMYVLGTCTLYVYSM